MAGEEQLIVRRIKNGTVLDHIPTGTALSVLRILGLSNSNPENIVTIAMNVPSVKLVRKDIIKIENRYLTPEEANRLALIAPQATINLVKDYRVVDKRRVELPDKLEGIFRCPNPTCITNSGEPIETVLLVVKKQPAPLLRCHFCSRLIAVHEILKS